MILKAAVRLLCLVLINSPCFAKEKKASGDLPRVEISDVKTTPAGEVLLAVKIFASNVRDLQLMSGILESEPGVSEDPSGNNKPAPQPFSLNGSTLTDLRTKAVYANLPSLPGEPFVGSMETLTNVKPGGWIAMGIAFPPFPPPSEKKGKKLPYKLRFEIPHLNISTVVTLDPETLKPLGKAP